MLPLRNSRRRDRSTWLQFCSQCLADDAHPYFRRRWRLATRVACDTHGSRLRDRCPSCRSHVAAFDQRRARAATLLCPVWLRLAPRIGHRPMPSGEKTRPVH
ncbi:TniQ family protein [Rhizobium beringeri]